MNKEKYSEDLARAYCRFYRFAVKKYGLSYGEIKLQADYFITTLEEARLLNFRNTLKSFNAFVSSGFVGDYRKEEAVAFDTIEIDVAENKEEEGEEDLVELIEGLKNQPLLPSLLVRLGMNWKAFFNHASGKTFNKSTLKEIFGASKTEIKELLEYLNGVFADCLREEYKEKIVGEKRNFDLSRNHIKNKSEEETIKTILNRVKKYPGKVIPFSVLYAQLCITTEERAGQVEEAIEAGIKEGLFVVSTTRKGLSGLGLSRSELV